LFPFLSNLVASYYDIILIYFCILVKYQNQEKCTFLCVSKIALYWSLWYAGDEFSTSAAVSSYAGAAVGIARKSEGFMKIVTKNTRWKAGDTFRLWSLFDVHIGELSCNMELLKRDRQRILDDPTAAVILGGDLIGAIGRKDRRHNPAVVPPELRGSKVIAQRQAEYAADFFAPLADRIVLMTTGNHESKAADWDGFDPYRFIVRELMRARGQDVRKDKPDFAVGMSGVLRWKFRRGIGGPGSDGWTAVIKVHHGYGSAGVGLPGAIALKLGRALDRTSADYFMMGHLHDKVAVAKSADSITRYDIRPVERKAFMIPSYQRAPSPEDIADDLGIPAVTWQEQKGFAAKPQGAMQFLIDPAQKEMWGLF
jgi:hypothetical protein